MEGVNLFLSVSVWIAGLLSLSLSFPKDSLLLSMSLIKLDMLEHMPSSFFSFFFSKKNFPRHIFLFFTDINPPISGEISHETQNTWCHRATTIYPDGHCQNKINPYHHHSNLLPFLFFPYLSLVFIPFPSLYILLHFPFFFVNFLNC